MITIKFQSDSPREITEWAVRWLQKHDYKVEKLGEWEGMGAFCKRVGIAPRSFWRMRARSGCPEFETEEGETGRLIRIRVTPALERFVTLYKLTNPCPLNRK